MGETRPRTPGETDWLSLREAAERTGIPLDVLRKRVYRGTVPAAKVNGAYAILEVDLAGLVVPNGHSPPGVGVGPRLVTDKPSDTGETAGGTLGETVLGQTPDTGETSGRTADPLALDYIASLKEEIAFLRRELETRTDELQWRDVLLREALARTPALGVGENARSQDTGPVDSARPKLVREATGGAEPHRESVVVSRWRRLFGRG